MTGGTITIIAGMLLELACVVFVARRLLQLLRFLQQDDYRIGRFLRWWASARMFDTRGTRIALPATLLVGACASLHLPGAAVITTLGSLLLTSVGLVLDDPRTTGKVRLVMTDRAKKLYAVALILSLGTLITLTTLFLAATVYALFWLWVCVILLIQFAPLILAISATSLWPFEAILQRRYMDEARAKVNSLKPCVIGITGSFGKTSTKAIVGELLSTTLAATFWPAKGINTPMGITRDIRARLSRVFPYAVIEMGAYHIGSIKRLCAITPPSAGIITAVGTMHLERFGGPEAVYRAKSELAQAIPLDGILVANGDNNGARRMAKEFPKRVTLLYGMDSSKGPLDVRADGVTFSPDGMTFLIVYQGRSFPARTKLLGAPAVSNILAGFTMACALGAKPELVVAAIANLDPVENRLSLKRDGAITYLQDAYNSNPTGFAGALEVLQKMPAKRRVLMTPGMIELGNTQFAENEKIATLAAGICDFIFVVGDTNRAAWLKGLQERRYPENQIFVVEGRGEAFDMIAKLRTEGDVILIENDLPDLYERAEGF